MKIGLQEFLAVLDGMSDVEMTGPVDANGWNVRDHLTHLAAWAEGIAALLRRNDRWAAMGLNIGEPEAEPDYDQLNAEIVVQHRHMTPSQARAWLVAVHRVVATAVHAMSEEELLLPYDRFVAPFTGDRGQAISEYILGNTEDHYDEHTPWVLAIAAAR